MRVTLILSTSPVEGDAVFNGLRLAKVLAGRSHDVRLFIMNDAVDAVRESFDQEEIRGLVDDCIASGISVWICTTCVLRCGIAEGEMRSDATLASMDDLADWIEDADRVLTF